MNELGDSVIRTIKTDRSPTLGKLGEAMAKAQGQMEGASKDSANPFFKSKYADLASVWAACRKPLSDNNLAVIQMPTRAEDPGAVAVETMILHSSGEFISGVLEMAPVKKDPQGVGSCLTYIRRYALQSAVGIAPEDDDGNAASGNRGGAPAPGNVARTTEDSPQPELILPPTSDLIDQDQVGRLNKRFRDTLPDTLKPQAEALLHDFLGRRLILDKDANPSARAIRKVDYAEIGKAAIAFAKEVAS